MFNVVFNRSTIEIVKFLESRNFFVASNLSLKKYFLYRYPPEFNIIFPLIVGLNTNSHSSVSSVCSALATLTAAFQMQNILAVFLFEFQLASLFVSMALHFADQGLWTLA